MPKPSFEPRYENTWALVVGINKYRHASSLNYATNDARAIADVLEGRFKFPKSNMFVLLDESATNSEIRKLFMSFTNQGKIQPNDRLIVFFAGHGHTVAGKRGDVGFLVPVDGKPGDLDTLIRWDELTRNADLIPAKHIFFVMDACYGGLAISRGPEFGSMRFLGNMLQRYARQVLTAGKADETVADGNGVRPGHSIFTAHLLDALEGSAATTEGVITASGVMAYVYDRVARDQYSHQTPHYGFVEGDGDFIFDTSLLEKAQAQPVPKSSEGEGQQADLLINTTPQVVTIAAEADVPTVTKQLLSDPSQKIRLDDFVSLQTREFLDKTDLRHFPVQGVGAEKEMFIERVAKYEDLSRDLQQIAILLAKWSEPDQLRLLETMLRRIAESDKGSAGLLIWLNLSWYPVLLLMYSAGIAALAVGRYDALRVVLTTLVQPDSTRNGRVPLTTPTIDNLTRIYDTFKWLPGHDRHYVPRSEHLFKVLQPILEDMLFLGKSYEHVFDQFEVFLALAYADATDKDWAPTGRFGWKHRLHGSSPFSDVIAEVQQEGKDSPVLKAGLFRGSMERLLKASEGYGALLNKLNWY
jgi:uncharacterized caspase-like protein